MMEGAQQSAGPVRPAGDRPDGPAPPGSIRVAWRLLRQGVPGEWPRIVPGLLLLLAASGVTLLQPWPLKLILDVVVDGHAPPAPLARVAFAVGGLFGLGGNLKLSLLLVLCLAALLIQALMGALKVTSDYVLADAGFRMVFKLRCLVFDHIQRLSLAYHNATSVGDSLYRVTSDANSVQEIFNKGVVPMVTASATLAGILLVMLTRDPTLTLAALSMGVPLLLLIGGLDRLMTERSLRVHERESAVSTRVQETLWGIRAVQAFGREDFESARFRRRADASLRANLHLNLLQNGSQAVTDLLLTAGVALVLWIAASRVLAGRLTPGDVVLLVSYVWMLYDPLETLAYTAPAVQSAAAGARRVYAVLDTPSTVENADGAIALPGKAAGLIVFENVSFHYREGRPVLSDLSLEIPAGTTVALVGLSGAGKTTLAGLVPRFYDPVSGRVTLDGHDLKALALPSLRRNVALVLQEPILFDASIRENIAYGRPEAAMDEIRAAARAAGAHAFIETLPKGYETRIGEQGNILSGGQRQRIAIARAFLKDAPVLVLDEPTGSLDAEAEGQLLETLEELMRGRTTLLIAHRLSAVRRADRIVVLANGRTVEAGTHGELMARDGLYARLQGLQSGVRRPGRRLALEGGLDRRLDALHASWKSPPCPDAPCSAAGVSPEDREATANLFDTRGRNGRQ